MDERVRWEKERDGDGMGRLERKRDKEGGEEEERQSNDSLGWIMRTFACEMKLYL